MFDRSEAACVCCWANMFKRGGGTSLFAALVVLTAAPVHAQVYGAAVQVSNGKRMPAEAQLAQILRPGDMIRDMLGWHKADPTFDLVGNPARQITIPAAMLTLYQSVEDGRGKDFVSLG